MTNSLIRIFVLAFAMVAFIAPQAKADMPIGVIDLAKIIETSAAGKDLQAKFKTRKEAVQKEADAFESDLKAKEQALIKDSKTMDEKAFNEKRATVGKDLQKKKEAIISKNVALEKSKNGALKSIQAKVAQICADIAEQKKIQVILDRSAVVIAQQSLDITADVITKLDSTLKTVDLK